MKVTWNWLREFVAIDTTPEALAERLTMGGLEVESIQPAAAELSGVVAARVLAVTPHPNAERLNVCRVTIDGGEPLQVVCGAPDVAVDGIFALARPGSTLKGGKRIEASEIRGVASAGMLCSAVELGLGDDAAGLLRLGEAVAPGTGVDVALGLDDWVLEVSITPNRGDCLSVLGLAREIAALTGARLLPRDAAGGDAVGKDGGNLPVTVVIDDADGCGRYVARLLHEVTIAPSPLRLQQRLRAVGLRPINNVVDVTNYVMLERGQPLHAFDYDRLPAAEVRVRRARAGERLRTLDGEDRALVAGDLLITSGDLPIALAGVMGGENTEVTDATRNVLLESAWFDPTAVRLTAKQLGLRSEASYRFERTTDIANVAEAAERAVQLMAEHAGARVARGTVDVYPGRRPSPKIPVRGDRIARLLGIELPSDEIRARLRAFGMAVDDRADGDFEVVPPSSRSDLTREVDVIEELARAIGYERIPATLPRGELSGAGEAPRRRKRRALSRLLTSLGLNELVLLSFASAADNQRFPGWQAADDSVRLLNPLTQDDAEMRRSLLPGLLRVARHNRAQGSEQFAGFHCGKVFWRSAGGHCEAARLGLLIHGGIPHLGLGRRGAATAFDDIKGVVEAVLEQFGVVAAWSRLYESVAEAGATDFHPGLSARLDTGGHRLGVAGRVHPELADEFDLDPDCWLVELDLEYLLEYEPPPIRFKELSRFPAVVRDLAVVVEDRFESAEVIDFIRRFDDGGLIEAVELFDSYVGEPLPRGKKSLAFSVSYRAIDRTLTDQEVNELHQRLVAALRGNLPVEFR